jgi:tetratricopeptide (TPR) repeat protein
MRTLKILAAGAAAAALLAASTPQAVGQPAPAAHDMSAMPGMDHPAAAPASAPPMDRAMHSMQMPAMPSVYMGQADKAGAPTFTGLGAHRHHISTRNADTQRLFDQGVNLLFGFNHAEAIRSFREAARLDPNCAMCWWGVAFALGPNINLAMPEDAIDPAWVALQRARALRSHATRAERAWIDALSTRYAESHSANRAQLDAAFAGAMGRLAARYPADLDAQVFYAEAMMDTQPWDYYQPDGVHMKGHGDEIIAVLERVMARAPDHPGALHLYIHAVEASTTPQRAEAASDRLLTLMPGAGHVVHMPSHIYYRVGRYADSARANERAALVDEAYIAECRAQGFYPAGYYGHNIHFLWTSSEMQGRYAASIDAARRLVRAVDAVNLASQLPLGELFVFTPTTTLLRFGRWRELLAEPAPPEALTLDLAVWNYAQGFAHANTGDLAAARADRARLEALTHADLSRFVPFNVPALPMMQLSLALLDGEIARKSGDLPGAIAHFREAQRIELALPYTEPPYWHQPVSHILGAALLEAGRPAEAEAVYRESLRSYRLDGWALTGLAQALDAQHKTAEAAEARRQLAIAWQLADVQLTSSRF